MILLCFKEKELHEHNQRANSSKAFCITRRKREAEKEEGWKKRKRIEEEEGGGGNVRGKGVKVEEEVSE